MRSQASLALVFLCWAGCAVRKPSAYSLLPRDNRQILIPPGIASPKIVRRTFTAEVAKGSGICPVAGPVAIQPHKMRLRVSVDVDALAKQSPGWLSRWSAELESQGCVAPGEGAKLAQAIVESLPLELNAAFRLLYPNDRVTGELDVLPRSRLHVLSPIVREPGAPILVGPSSVSGDDHQLTLTFRSTDNLLGYEIAWYEVQARPGAAGSIIVPLSAEARIGSDVRHGDSPAVNYFRFPAAAGFYRLFYEADQTDFTALIVAADSSAELEQRSRVLEAGPAACSRLPGGWCATIPKDVAVNLLLPVTVNREEVLVAWGATVANAIRAAGEPQPSSILQRLEVQKPYRGRATPVKFDPASRAILDMILTGGEIISWPR